MIFETAEIVYRRALAFDDALTSLLEAVDVVEDVGLREQFKTAATDVMGLVFREILHPLEQRYPNLVPGPER